MFGCINRALQLKDAITTFSENDMEMDGRIDCEDDEDTSDGEARGIVKEMVRITHPHFLLFPYMLCFFLRFVSLRCLQLCTSPEHGYIFTPDHWACYEQLGSKMKVLTTVRIKLDSNKHVTISHVLYFFSKLLYETKSALGVDRIMSNHYVYAHEFSIGFRKKLLDSIDDPERVYMLGIATLLDGRHRSVEFMEAAWSVELRQEWKRVTTQWASFEEIFNALQGGIIDMVSVHQELEIM